MLIDVDNIKNSPWLTAPSTKHDCPATSTLLAAVCAGRQFLVVFVSNLIQHVLTSNTYITLRKEFNVVHDN